MQAKEWMSSDAKRQLDDRIQEEVELRFGDSPEHQMNAIRNFVAVGKRIRPYFLYALSECKPQKISNEVLLQLATAIELTHQASIIFDDMSDESETRDGIRESLHVTLTHEHKSSQMGRKHTSIITQSFIWRGLNLAVTTPLSPESKQQKVYQAFLDAGIKTLDGEQTGSLGRNKQEPYPEYTSWVQQCMNLVYMKTSALLSLPFHLAHTLHADPNDMDDLSPVGLRLGQCYQLLDDADDQEKDTAPGPASLTFPLAVLLDEKDQMPPEDQQLLREMLRTGRITEEQSEQLRSILDDKKAMVANRTQQELVHLRSGISLPPPYETVAESINGVLDSAQSRTYWQYRV